MTFQIGILSIFGVPIGGELPTCWSLQISSKNAFHWASLIAQDCFTIISISQFLEKFWKNLDFQIAVGKITALRSNAKYFWSDEIPASNKYFRDNGSFVGKQHHANWYCILIISAENSKRVFRGPVCTGLKNVNMRAYS